MNAGPGPRPGWPACNYSNIQRQFFPFHETIFIPPTRTLIAALGPRGRAPSPSHRVRLRLRLRHLRGWHKLDASHGLGSHGLVDYDYQDQDHNWSGSSEAPDADNSDKDIRTSWETFGYQDMFDRSWGIRLEIPYEERHFVTVSNAPGGPLTDLNFSGFGDIRIEGIYTGFSPDLSSGLTFGLKLPTGSYTTNNA